MKKIIENIILVEPKRFNSEDLIDLSNQYGFNSNEILKLKSQGVSKIWIWKSTGEVICFKTKENSSLDHNNIDIDFSKIETFKLSDEPQENLNLDSILDKISISGVESLTSNEKNFLRNQ